MRFPRRAHQASLPMPSRAIPGATVQSATAQIDRGNAFARWSRHAVRDSVDPDSARSAPLLSVQAQPSWTDYACSRCNTASALFSGHILCNNNVQLRTALAKAAITTELFKLSINLGRLTWSGHLAFGLLIVMILWRENRLPVAFVWWSALAALVVARSWYCQHISNWMTAHPNKLPRWAQLYAALAALEGTTWALALVLLAASNESAAILQFVLTIAVLLGALLAFAPAGMPWVAFAVPLGFAQLVFLLSRELPLHDITMVSWALTLLAAAAGFVLLRRALSNNVAMRT